MNGPGLRRASQLLAEVSKGWSEKEKALVQFLRNEIEREAMGSFTTKIVAGEEILVEKPRGWLARLLNR